MPRAKNWRELPRFEKEPAMTPFRSQPRWKEMRVLAWSLSTVGSSIDKANRF
jgi:hypothetical protein